MFLQCISLQSPQTKTNKQTKPDIQHYMSVCRTADVIAAFVI